MDEKATNDIRNLNHNMARIILFMNEKQNEWYTKAELSKQFGNYNTFKRAYNKLVFLRLIKQKRGIKFNGFADLSQLNFRKRNNKSD